MAAAVIGRLGSGRATRQKGHRGRNDTDEPAAWIQQAG